MNVNDLRIISFLPAATEMAYALGLDDCLVGVSHECDYPPRAKKLPVVVRPVLPLEKMSLREIDVAVAARIGSGQSLYQVDETLLRELKPNLILTQNLCQVCGPAGNEMTVALKLLQPKPEVVWMTPHSIEDIFQNLRDLGAATGRNAEAESLIAESRQRLQRISDRAKHLPRPRVFFMEWADPVYCAGHWVPEMIEMAGGRDGLARKGVDSVRMAWEDVIKWAPEILILSPCGFHLKQGLEQLSLLRSLPKWAEIPAVRDGRVYVTDANGYFARPGPRVVEGTELLAHIIHPELFNWKGPDNAYRRVSLSGEAASARLKTCPKCRATFVCKSGNCWCEHFPPLPPSAEPGVDCLCPVCLAEAIENDRAQKPKDQQQPV